MTVRVIARREHLRASGRGDLDKKWNFNQITVLLFYGLFRLPNQQDSYKLNFYKEVPCGILHTLVLLCFF